MKNSKIAWTDHTFNPWTGCTPKSEGCERCYAKAMHQRWHGNGSFAELTVTSANYWEQPYRWNLEAKKTGKRQRVFCGSMCDWLHEDADPLYQAMLMRVVSETPELDWLMLTKRPENFGPMLTRLMTMVMPSYTARMVKDWAEGAAPWNVWFGVTCENQERWDERVKILKYIPARVRWVSAEPLLGPIVPTTKDTLKLDWIVAGGENGTGARPCRKSWIENLCLKSGNAKFFFKQWGDNPVDGGEVMPSVVELTREWPGA